MNFVKKLTIFCLSVLTCFCLAGAVACNNTQSDSSSEQASNSQVESGSSSEVVEDSSSTPEANTSYVYRVKVQNPTGFGLCDVSVSLYDGETLVAKQSTNTNGYANFRNNDDRTIAVGNYTIVLEELPDGYVLQDDTVEYTTSEYAGSTVEIPLMPTGVLSTQPETGSVYRLGDVMHDFTANALVAEKNDLGVEITEQTFTLSEILKEKELVVINFWATWCTPCKAEFPVLNSALLAYADSVACIAVSTTDSKEGVNSFLRQNGYSFGMTYAGQGNNVADRFSRGGVPQTILVDRYGVVGANHEGSITNLSDWTALFDIFVGDDYQPTVIGSTKDVEPEEDAMERIEPTVAAPALSDVANALDPNGAFEFRWQKKDVVSADDEGYDKYSWPYTIVEALDNDGNTISCIRAANGIDRVDLSYATLYADFTAKAGDVLVFDYKIGSETDYDVLYIGIDGKIVKEISGYHSQSWNTCYAYVFTEEEAGEHEIQFLYNKDGDGSDYDDLVLIDNLRLESVEDGIVDADNALILRYAASIENTDENATTQFKNYVDIVLNEEDNYYHVGDKNGPILFADLWYATQWNNMSVWQLAFNDYCVADGYNYHTAFEEFAWAANNNIISEMDMHGLVPVTHELRILLEIATEYIPYTEGWDNFDGAWHENEWLEICCYYQPYGNTEQLEDPLKTITFNAAVPLHVGTNDVEVPFAMNPRGFKYKFTPTESAIYKVYSTGSADPYVFLVDGDQKTFLGEWDDKLFAETSKDENGVEVTDGNFEFYWEFEAGKTYYLLFTTFGDQPGSYQVHIENVGDSYTYMVNAATAYYSSNLVSGELYIPDAIDYAYDEENDCYRYLDENGEMGSPIYVDWLHPTSFLNSISLYDLALAQEERPVEQRELYLNGKDYTTFVKQMGFKSNASDIRGFTVVTQEIYEFLYDLTVHSEHEGLYNSWLTLCYYQMTVSTND